MEISEYSPTLPHSPTAAVQHDPLQHLFDSITCHLSRSRTSIAAQKYFQLGFISLRVKLWAIGQREVSVAACDHYIVQKSNCGWRDHFSHLQLKYSFKITAQIDNLSSCPIEAFFLLTFSHSHLSHWRLLKAWSCFLRKRSHGKMW